MKIWNQILAWFAGPRPLVLPEPICVQDGALRAYIWPAKEHFGYEVVDAGGEKLCVGTDSSFDSARSQALKILRRMR
jgi:hypothetical protein